MRDKDGNLLGFKSSQWRLFTVVLVIGLSLVAFRVLRDQLISDTAALYVGLPVLFALAISLSAKAETTVGATMKGLAIALFLSAPVFMEGFICILFASPILFIVAALVAWLADRARKHVNARSKVQLSTIVTLLIAASLEGTPYQLYEFSDRYKVSYARIVNKTPEQIKENISTLQLSGDNRPLFLRLFPFPVSVSGQGLQPGAEHKVDYVYKKWFVANEHKGTTVFRVDESTDTSVRFVIPSDTSYLSHYMTWKSSKVAWSPVSDSATRITWSLEFTRDLDPAWYFGPLQTYAAWLSAKVLVSHAAS